jgi:hypothetical protein
LKQTIEADNIFGAQNHVYCDVIRKNGSLQQEEIEDPL